MDRPVYQTFILGGDFTGLFTALHLAHEHYPRSVIAIKSLNLNQSSKKQALNRKDTSVKDEG